MKTCQYEGQPLGVRSHPWTNSAASTSFRYLDLKASPSLIRTSLEDFVPWSRYPAVQRFYALLEWLNGKVSVLESNDCEFSGPAANQESSLPAAVACSGRLMVLFRDLGRNRAAPHLHSLVMGLHRALGDVDAEFQHGMLGTSLVPVRFLALRPVGKTQLGQQLMLSFWAWGDCEADTMANLDRLMANLAQAVQRADAECRGVPRTVTD